MNQINDADVLVSNACLEERESVTHAAPSDDWDETGATRELFDVLLQPGMGVIAASSGNFKSLLLTNLAVHAAQNGAQIMFVHLDMPASKTRSRFRRMITKTSAREPDQDETEYARVLNQRVISDPELKALAERVVFQDFTLENCRAEFLLRKIRAGLADKLNSPNFVLIVDGSECVQADFGKQQEIASLVSGLAQIADAHNVPVWCSSQVRRDADGQEIVSRAQVSEAIEKVEKAGMVVTLGTRVDNHVLTLCVDKDRNGICGYKRVHRLRVASSLQLLVMPAEDYRLKPACGLGNPDIITVGVRLNDLPFGDASTDDADIEGDDGDIRDSVPSHNLLKPFHGLKGFVPVGREIFVSAIYQNRDMEAFFYLMDLYNMAQIAPAKAYAPGTHISVQLERGEAFISLSILSKHWNIGKSKVRRLLKCFRQEGLISIEKITGDLRRIPVTELADDTSSDTKTRTIVQVVKCLHYPAKITKEDK